MDNLSDDWVIKELRKQGLDPMGNPLDELAAPRPEPAPRNESGHDSLYASTPQYDGGEAPASTPNPIMDEERARLRMQANEAERAERIERTGDDGQEIRELKREQRRAEYEERQRDRNYEAGGKRAERQAEIDGSDAPPEQNQTSGPRAYEVTEDELIRRIAEAQQQSGGEGGGGSEQREEEKVQLLRDIKQLLETLGTIP